MPIIPPIEELRPASPEDLAATSRRIKASFAPGPVLVPYEEWVSEIDALCYEQKIALAEPRDLSMRLTGEPDAEPRATVENLLRYQEIFYRTVYGDPDPLGFSPSFTIDRAKLSLSRDRLDDIKAALLRREVNYPLVVATPRNGFSPSQGGGARGGGDGNLPTLHRVLFDRLIRQRNIRVAAEERTNFTRDDLFEQVRDLTLADLTRADLIGNDGKRRIFTEQPGHYLTALYPLLPRPTAEPGYVDLAFVKWEQDPHRDRILNVVVERESNDEPMAMVRASPIGAVTGRYPLIPLSQYLALFAQYHAATGRPLDQATWSWTFAMVEKQSFMVHARWRNDMLELNIDNVGYAPSSSRLRCAW